MDHAAVPTVSDYMTPAPYCVAPNDPLPRAHAIMREHEISHLPVMKGPELVGILWGHGERDPVRMPGSGLPADSTVESAMIPCPYVVAADLPLTKVARVMLDRKMGCAVVLDGDRVAGVFTVTDALRALIEALDGTYSRRGYDGVTTEPAETRSGRDVH
jgi:CBS domain-containing protein